MVGKMWKCGDMDSEEEGGDSECVVEHTWG